MKGYLQRMVASTRKPESGLHPVVRPIFPAPTEPFRADYPTDLEAVSGGHTESTAEAGPPLIRHSNSPANTIEAPAAESPSPTQPDHLPTTPGQGSESRTAEGADFRPPPAFRPLMQTPVMPSAKLAVPVSEPKPAREAAWKTRRSPPMGEGLEARIQTGSEGGMAEFQAKTEHSKPEPSRVPQKAAPPVTQTKLLVPPVARRREPAGSHAQPKKERESEEIRIHIGRIEVTAVPAAVQPPARTPARKSLNLDEYLKRSR